MSTTTSQQFEGSTIEEALEAAVATLGDDLEIIDAQRVRRRGVLGVGRRERYEVTAARKAAQADAFDSVLRRMVDRVDQAEDRLGVDLADTDLSWWQEADFVLPRPKRAAAPRPSVVDVREDPERGRAPVADAHRAAAGYVDVRDGVEAAAVRPKRAANPTAVDADVNASGGYRASHARVANLSTVGWSHERLLEIGLPSALVDRLPRNLHSDLDWVAALAKAIDELLETAETMSGPCELTGHGQHAVVHLIRGACDGFRVGALVIDGERVPATPMELALAVRAMVRDIR